jgi:hypothetical protein
MRRWFLLSALAFVFSLSCLVGPARAASDDEIPGNPLTIGSSISQAVSSGDVSDVYAVSLTEGQEVHIRCDPGTSDKGSFRLLGPGAPSISQWNDYVGTSFNLSGGTFLKYWADFDYIPPRSGTYYLWVQWEEGTLSYSLSIARTSRAALDLAADSDNIPGTPMGSGTVTGVVSTNVDDDDVYAVALQAGQPVTVRLMPLLPFTSGYALAYLSLLDPTTPSISSWYSHGIGERQMAENNKYPDQRKMAEIQYTPSQTGTYFIWVEDGGAMYAKNFGYQLSVSGGGEPPEPPGGFTDVAGSPYETAIYDLADRGIITGPGDGTFRPNDPVTRQQFAKMIVGTLDLSVTGTEVCPFPDVDLTPNPKDPLYPAKYVAVCAAHEITKGYRDGRFYPYEDIKRMQLITMVARAAGLADPPAGYVPPFGVFDPDHFPFAKRAAAAGLLDGLVGVGPSYNFVIPATRGECAQLLHNLLQRQ